MSCLPLMLLLLLLILHLLLLLLLLLRLLLRLLLLLLLLHPYLLLLLLHLHHLLDERRRQGNCGAAAPGGHADNALVGVEWIYELPQKQPPAAWHGREGRSLRMPDKCQIDSVLLHRSDSRRF